MMVMPLMFLIRCNFFHTPFALLGSARRANSVTISHSNTQAVRVSGRHGGDFRSKERTDTHEEQLPMMSVLVVIVKKLSHLVILARGTLKGEFT